MSQEGSPGGSDIFRHAPRTGGKVEPAYVPPDWRDAIKAHVALHVGETTSSCFETISDIVQIDVHFVEPGPRNYWPLHTTGMSARPMSVPGDVETSPFAELMLFLPHEHATWLAHGHSVPNGDPPEPYHEDTKLCGALLLTASSHAPDLHEVEGDGKTVTLLSVLALHADEMAISSSKARTR